jgi:hypothetical protein
MKVTEAVWGPCASWNPRVRSVGPRHTFERPQPVGQNIRKKTKALDWIDVNTLVALFDVERPLGSQMAMPPIHRGSPLAFRDRHHRV